MPSLGSKSCINFESSLKVLYFIQTESPLLKRLSFEITSRKFILAPRADTGILEVPVAAAPPFAEPTGSKIYRDAVRLNLIYIWITYALSVCLFRIANIRKLTSTQATCQKSEIYHSFRNWFPKKVHVCDRRTCNRFTHINNNSAVFMYKI